MGDKYLGKVKFLIVEDNSFMRTIIRRVLAALEVGEAVEATDGADALKILKTYAPDIIITDWAMDPVDGIELTRMLRTNADSPNPYVPIIMLSAHSEANKIVEARDAGVNEFVVKPISVNTLFSRIQAVIERPRPFVRIPGYFGPDRRRRNTRIGEPDRRKAADPVAEQQDINRDEIDATQEPTAESGGT